jgi:putative inorganic carbon (HCO3(-)) transporter
VTERLAFGYGTGGHRGEAPPRAPVASEPGSILPAAEPVSARAETEGRRDWAFIGLLAFTAALYFRPQDQLPGLAAVPFAELSALLGLTAMAFNRLSRGLPLTRITPELVGVASLAFVILLTAPFSVWPGGAVGTFTDTFVKVLLIFVLMVNTVTTVERLHRFMTVVVVATGYLATRAVFDYARGFNLVENGRVQGAVGGMFQNPNDLALNMVAVLPLAVLVALRARTTAGRLGAAFLGLMMVGSIMVSYSRGGFVGLAVMIVILGIQLARRRPAVVAAAAVGLLLTLPFAPASYWERVSSITDDSLDATGSREARRILLREAWGTFLEFPLHGVGAGQFQNYNPPDRVEIWRETHNVVLQIAAELGILGVGAFGFLLWRALSAGGRTRRLLRRASGAAPPSRWQLKARDADPAVITPDQANYLEAHAGALTAAVIGWFVCALFASVAYSWTFYYLLALAAAPHYILTGRLAARAAAGRAISTPQLAEARI